METLVVSAYPACGKTYFYEKYKDKYKILDSDSSNFSWKERKRTEAELQEIKRQWNEESHLMSAEGYINQIKDDLIKERDPNFPNNYIQHIKDNIGKVDTIFVSSHAVVRYAMQCAGIKYITVYPDEDCLNEWIGRMYRRGNDKSFIDLQIKMWDVFMGRINNEPYGIELRRLKHDEYLDSIMFDYLY